VIVPDHLKFGVVDDQSTKNKPVKPSEGQ